MLTLILSVAAVCMVVERVIPGHPLPSVPTWPLRVVLVNAVQLCVVLLAGVTWEHWMSGRSLLFDARELHPLVAGLGAYFVATFVFYWWHRRRHTVSLFWRAFHQIHHSPRRIELITSFYKHPGELVRERECGLDRRRARHSRAATSCATRCASGAMPNCGRSTSS